MRATRRRTHHIGGLPPSGRVHRWIEAKIELRQPMIFIVFAPLAFIVIRLSVNWRWRTVALTAAAIGLVADVVFDYLIGARL